MEDESDFRRWDELIPDALGLIFRNLSLEEILTVVPNVCKSWGRAVTGPYCWQEIDIEEWSQHREPENIDQMVQLLVNRSCCSLRKLCVSGISSDQTFFSISNHARSLQTLRVPRSKISNSIVEQVADMFCNLTFLDLSYCMKIGAQGLEAIGKHCKSLTVLQRNMHPIDVIDIQSQDDEAHAIALTMPRLKHLEIAYLLVDTTSVLEILKSCTQLELLDLRGCWRVDLDENFAEKVPEVKLVGPHVVDCYYMNGWEDDDYDQMSDIYWEEEINVEGAEMWFYADGHPMDVCWE